MAKEKLIIIPGLSLLTSLEQPWGGENRSDDVENHYGTDVPVGYKWGVNFAEVERFIKSQLGSEANKIGYFAMVNLDGANYLLGFDSLESYQAWELDHSDPDNQPLVTAEMETHERYIARVATNSDTSDLVTNEPSHTVGVRFTSLIYEGGEYVNSGLPGTLTFLRSIDGGVTFTVVGQESIVSREETALTFDSFDIGRYLRDGYKNIIAVRASFSAGGSTYTSRQITVASVTYTSLSLVCLSDWHVPIESSDIVTDGLRLRYRASHAVDAVLHISVECGLGTLVTTHQLLASTSGTAQIYTVYDTMSYGLTSHGVRKVTAWLTCSDGASGELTGNVLVNRFMVIDAATAGANIDKPYLMIQNEVNSAENFMQTRLCDIAVYSPDGSPVPLDINITSEAENYPSGDYEVYFPQQIVANPGEQIPLDASLEIEDNEDATVPAYLRIWSGNDNILQRSVGRVFIYVAVDNSQSFAPKAGATFILNPRLRSNSEETPKRIINAKNGNVVTSSWEGFDLGPNDGWVKSDEGLRVLRVLSGQRLTIGYNPFAQFIQYPNSSMTFELDIKVRNVTDENSTVLGVSEQASGRTRGLVLRAMSGNLYAQSEPNDSETNFRWQEGVRTHIVVNINNNVETDINGDGLVTEEYYASQGSPSTTRMFARVFINGDIEREIMLSGSNAQEFCTGLMSNGGIVIGQDGADIDIYSIRCYERMALESKDIVDNYISTLPTAADKRAVHDANDIMSGTKVDVQKVKALGKRVLILHGKEPYKYDTSASGNWWEIHQYDSEGHEIPELSGTICKETGFGEVKRQGSTANTYYYSNLQTKIDDAGTIDVSIEDIHESMTVSEPYEKDGVMVVDIYGGNLGKKDPVVDEPKQYPINNGMVTVPDGWIDGNGKYRGMGFMIAEGTPLATKLVLKINYASSMQSHVTGCLKLFDDLHRAVVGENELQQHVSSARVSKYTEPVFFFTQLDDNASVVFRGMGNFGAGKMDKPTWGYVKSVHPMFTMIEGSDNDQELTDCRVPFSTDPDCPECITYDPGEEGYFYGDIQNLDFDGGKTDDDGYPAAPITARLKETWNWIYMHAPSIRRFNGAYDAFLASNPDTSYKYWCNSGGEAFKLKRYDGKNGVWRDAGLWDETNKQYGTIDLRTYELTSSVYDAYLASLNTANPISQEQLNKNFISAIAADANKYIGFYFNVRSLKFHYAFINHFFAGTDNCSKNTYFVLMPYAKNVTIDGETRQCYLWELHQDDVDTILITDNNGRSTKPYYIDRMHPYDDDNPGESCYMGAANQLFNLCEAMWETEGSGSEIAAMLSEIFTAMVGLVTDEDVSNGYSKTLWGCMQKYMLSSQHYFPQMAYNEQARIRYEFPETLGFVSWGKGERHIRPITQSMGSQLQAESQFIKRRLLYMASYAAWGDFRGDNNYRVGLADAQDSFGFEPRPLPTGDQMSYYLDVTPHMYLYPSGAVGQTAITPRHRVAPNVTWRLNIGTATGDTGVSLFAIHLYRSIGNVGDQSVNPNNSATVSGNRLTSFLAEPNTQYNVDGYMVGAYRPNKINLAAPLLRAVSLNGSGIGGSLDISGLSRLVSLDLRGTYITEISFAETKRLVTVHLPASLTKLIIDGQPNIGNTAVDANAEISIEGTSSLQDIRIVGNTNIALFTRQTVFNALDASEALSSIVLDNVNWTGQYAMPIALFEKLLDVDTVDIKGTIEIAESQQQTVTLAFVNRILEKFPTLYDAGSELTITYTERALTGGSIVCTNAGVGDYFDDLGMDYHLGIVPTPATANNVHKVVWSLNRNGATGNAQIDSATGVLNVTALNATGDSTKIIVTATVTTSTGTIVITKNVALYEQIAAPGDYVFADGTFGDSLVSGKTPVAICFYVNPNNNKDRLAVALKHAIYSLQHWGMTTSAVPNATIQGYDCYDTPVDNITEKGVNDVDDIASYADFANYASNTAIGDFGLKTLTEDIGEYRAGDIIHIGHYKTLQIIEHRNTIIQNCAPAGIEMSIPASSASETETQALTRLIGIIKDAKGDSYTTMYYGTVSYAYAYEPTDLQPGEVLSEKFRARKWFLPTVGEMARIYWLERHDTIFNAAFNAGVYKKLNDGGLVNLGTSTEYSNNFYFLFESGSGNFFGANCNKHNNTAPRPIVEF